MIEIRTAFIPRVPRSISNVTLSPSVIPSGAEGKWEKNFSPLPKSLIKRAEEILEVYENQEKRETIYTQTSLFDLEKEEEINKDDKYLDKIKAINPLEMSPMDALNFLYRLKEEMKKEECENQ